MSPEDLVTAIQKEIDNGVAEMASAAAKRKVLDPSGNASQLPRLTSTVETLDRIEVGGRAFKLLFAQRGSLVCYASVVDSGSGEPDVCREANVIAVPGMFFGFVLVGDRRVLVGFTGESGSSVAVQMSGAKDVTLPLKNLPGVAGVKYFDVLVDANAVPLKATVSLG